MLYEVITQLNELLKGLQNKIVIVEGPVATPRGAQHRIHAVRDRQGQKGEFQLLLQLGTVGGKHRLV